MCIAELGRILICLLVCAFFEARTAQAHPVSQGAMEIVIFPDRIEVQATVSMEEVLVAAAYGRQKKMSYLETVQSHGDYLRAHLRLTADGRALDGSVVKVPEKTQSPLTYALEYRLRGGAPARIDVQQDVLREFEFAPGNPWEASYLVRIGEAGQPAVEGLLLTSKAPLRFDCEWGRAAGAPGLDQARMATAFVRHGITHILTGYDHLLFVGALVLAVVNLWDLVKVIGAFTLAHTITLTLAALDVFRLPGSIVEPMIAASIVFVAVQNVFWPRQSRSGSRLLVAFLFGLFHGLGFAGGLLEAMSGLRAAGALVAIMAFSAGVEIGHQLVVLPAFCALRLLRRVRAGAYRHDWLVQRYGSAVISLGGMIYLVAALR
ncbi:MAG TPA: HupE/UreJ family protein [Gammaproteobacteria bacterium]|nr:HupE/UreJ family protein [Gammaproteobacteria bacterium]